MMKKEYGRYVTPELAEHMAGKELKICHACQKSTIIGLPLHFFFPSLALRCSAAMDEPLRWGCEGASLLVSSMAATTGTQGWSMDVLSTVHLCFFLVTGEAAQGCIPVLWGAWTRTWSWWVWCSILVSLQRCCFLQIMVAKVYRTLGFCPALRLWHLCDFQCCQQPTLVHFSFVIAYSL